MRPDQSQDRLARIRDEVGATPFITDEELSAKLGVSIHTIRSDRKRLGIPEARKRARDYAEGVFGRSRALPDQDIIGELLEVETDKEGLSLLDTDDQMVVRKSGVVRGHILFAQANSLANAIVNAEVALTQEAEVKYLSLVRAGERVLAKARVVSVKGGRKVVEVVMKTKRETVFEGRFTIRCLSLELAEVFKEVKSEE